MVGYGVAMLLFAFIPRRWILPMARIGVVLMLGSLVFELITVLLSRNIWYVWIIFLMCALFSMGLLALNTPLSTNVGSLLYGVAYDLGYTAVFYLVGGAAALSGSMRYFRVFCVVECAVAVFMSSGLTYLFGGIESNFNLISLGIMVVLCGIALGISPMLNRRVFMTDWVSSLGNLSAQRYGKEMQEVAALESQMPLSLTPREREERALPAIPPAIPPAILCLPHSTT